MASAAVSTITPIQPTTSSNSISYLDDLKIESLNNDEIRELIKKIDSNINKQKSEKQRLQYQYNQTQNRLQANKQKLNENVKRPYLVGNITELFDEDKSLVLKTSTHQTIYCPNSGVIDYNDLKVNDLIGVNEESFVIFDTVPTDTDLRIKAMIVDEKPKETFADIGGLDEQIKQLIESIILPLKQPEIFTNIGIQTSKGILLHGPPGTGKTSLARACANESNATFIKLCATQLTDKNNAVGAEIVREIFGIAKKRAPCIIFIDEIDAIGQKRNDRNKTDPVLIQLLNELDGFENDENIKIIAATNRADVLDPALIRSGRIDRKIKCELPNENERVNILRVCANKMKCDKGNIDFKYLARLTQGFNGSQLKAVTVEAGMNVIKRNGDLLMFNDFIDGVNAVKMKKKSYLNYLY